MKHRGMPKMGKHSQEHQIGGGDHKPGMEEKECKKLMQRMNKGMGGRGDVGKTGGMPGMGKMGGMCR